MPTVRRKAGRPKANPGLLCHPGTRARWARVCRYPPPAQAGEDPAQPESCEWFRGRPPDGGPSRPHSQVRCRIVTRVQSDHPWTVTTRRAFATHHNSEKPLATEPATVWWLGTPSTNRTGLKHVGD